MVLTEKYPRDKWNYAMENDSKGMIGECLRVLRSGGRFLLFDANWHMPLYDEQMADRAEKRRL